MRAMSLLTAVLVLVAGCTQVDENPKFNPQAEMPSWTYDAPFYYRPSDDLPTLETVGEGIGVYYTHEQSFFIPHPGNCQLNGVPRIGVWFSTDQGNTWQKAGYYGVEQTHFSFLAEHDGTYWIRFVGPGQGVAECPPGVPHRIYVVDRQPPTIVLSVSPSPWENEKEKIARVYSVGQNVTLYWGVSDANLDPNTISMSICFADFPQNVIWSKLPETLKDSDSLTIEIPPEAVRDGGLRFRLEAKDKAGNIGVGMTDVLHASSEAAQPAAPAAQPAPSPFERTTGAGPQQRPGWPSRGQVLVAGTAQELAWLPPTAGEYGDLELQFSSNDGRTWQSVATGLKPGQTVTWTVPQAAGDACRLRIIAITQTATGGKSEVTLAMTELFTVAGEPGAPTAPAVP